MAKRRQVPADVDLGFSSEPREGTSLRRLFAASASEDTEMQRPVMIEISRLLDNPYQPRLEMREESLQELAQVIRQQGFSGILIARPHPELHDAYQLSAGHRRRDAARLADRTVLPVVVQPLTDYEMLIRSVTENIQREDLTPLEEGKVYAMMFENLGMTYEQISREVGKSISYIRNRKRAADSPHDIQNLVRVKPDSLMAVVYLSRVADEAQRAEIIRLLIDGLLTVDDVPGYIEELRAAERAGEPATMYVAMAPAESPSRTTPPRAVFVNGEPLEVDIPDDLHSGIENLDDSLSGEAYSERPDTFHGFGSGGPSDAVGNPGSTHGQRSADHKRVDYGSGSAPENFKLVPAVEGDVTTTPTVATPPRVEERLSAEQEVRERRRIRRAKLSSAVTALIRYREFLTAADDPVTPQERQQLDQLATVVTQIRAHLRLD